MLVEWTVKDGLFSYFFTLYEVTESPDAYMPFVIRTHEVSRRTLWFVVPSVSFFSCTLLHVPSVLYFSILNRFTYWLAVKVGEICISPV